ncbi:MAG: hypothetical protein V7K35_26665 [Nostoc sp.]|uniref:hypothetical protein n=1 Tax=Nostoc sp. TaxID=1180 RepID=UPI002FFA3AE9
MDTHNNIAVIVGITAVISTVYKLLIEPSIDAKIAGLETKGFLAIDTFKSNLNDKIIVLDRKVDIHLQDYTNYKEANLLHNNGLNEKINHTWNKTKELFSEEKATRKEIQAFFQKQHGSKNPN